VELAFFLARESRLCVAGVDAAAFAEDWDIKRNTLLEIVDTVESSTRQFFSDARLLEDTFTMVCSMQAKLEQLLYCTCPTFACRSK
jgi:hypothetical protein